jgi:FeS assembly SUF system protein
MTETSPVDVKNHAVEEAAAMLAVDEHAGDKKRMAEVQALGEQIVEQLKTVYDPEIPVNIYELGLVYKIDVEDDNTVLIDMTLTSPHCPVAETLPPEVEQKVQQVEGVTRCEVRIVWDPPWTPSMMTEEAQLEMGLIY